MSPAVEAAKMATAVSAHLSFKRGKQVMSWSGGPSLHTVYGRNRDTASEGGPAGAASVNQTGSVREPSAATTPMYSLSSRKGGLEGKQWFVDSQDSFGSDLFYL